VTDPSGFLGAANGSSQVLTDSGVVSFYDLDDGDLVSISFEYRNDIVWSGGAIDPALSDALVAGLATGPV
jgi:hypothetical protein